MSAAALCLDDQDQALLEGKRGPAMQFAMELVVRAARIMAAPRLVPVTFAHIDACFYNGRAHVDFARFLLDHDARFAVPAWTNNGLAPLTGKAVHDEGSADSELLTGSRELMQLYEALGCKCVWTCAPYQLPGGPKFGDHIVVGESNAVSFYNSVVGARTNKYGDYLDVACALVGKAPYAGLHRRRGRRGEILFEVDGVPARFRRENMFYHLLGHHVGGLAGQLVPVIAGLPETASRDDLKGVSAAVAASGGVELWHGLGVTPEAQDMQAAFGGGEPRARYRVTLEDLAAARAALSPLTQGPVAMVALGTPHFSLSEFAALVPLLEGRKVAAGTKLYISTSRFVRELAAQKGWVDVLEKAGATLIVDSCTYYAPAVRGCAGRVMTNAAKWAYYAPGMLGVEVGFGSLRECAETAIRGDIWRDRDLWP